MKEEMNEDLVWTKTILTVYRYLERISDAIDKIVLESGLNCGKFYHQNYYYNNVLSISQKMIDLSERKVTLINLKLLTEQVLGRLKEKNVSILIARYVDGCKYREICDRCHISLRTIYRRLEVSELEFSRRLIARGYDANSLHKMLANEKWILSVYNHLKEKKNEFEVSPAFLAKVVSM